MNLQTQYDLDTAQIAERDNQRETIASPPALCLSAFMSRLGNAQVNLALHSLLHKFTYRRFMSRLGNAQVNLALLSLLHKFPV